MCGLLERFPGYTYSTLLDEDPEFLRLVAIEAFGKPDQPAQQPHRPPVAR